MQLINRVGWDGAIRGPEDNELGWKETVRMNPLEDCIVAMRASAPKQPFGLPDSMRPLNPMRPLGDPWDFFNVDHQWKPDYPAAHQRHVQLRLGVYVALPHPEP